MKKISKKRFELIHDSYAKRVSGDNTLDKFCAVMQNAYPKVL